MAIEFRINDGRLQGMDTSSLRASMEIVHGPEKEVLVRLVNLTTSEFVEISASLRAVIDEILRAENSPASHGAGNMPLFNDLPSQDPRMMEQIRRATVGQPAPPWGRCEGCGE